MIDRPQPRSLAELAAAEREAAPDLEAEARVWAGVEQRLLHGPPPPDLPVAGAGASITALKWIGGLVLVGGLVGGAAVLATGEPAPPVDAPAVADPAALAPVPEDRPPARWPTAGQVAPPVIVRPAIAAPVERAPLRATPVERPSSSAPPTTTPPPTAPPPTGPTEPLDLAAELRLIASIRAALQRGDAELALARIAEHRKKFGEDAALAQERGAHEVEAVCAAGRGADARRLAGVFLTKWPDSPHRARVAASCPP